MNKTAIGHTFFTFSIRDMLAIMLLLLIVFLVFRSPDRKEAIEETDEDQTIWL